MSGWAAPSTSPMWRTWTWTSAMKSLAKHFRHWDFDCSWLLVSTSYQVNPGQHAFVHVTIVTLIFWPAPNSHLLSCCAAQREERHHHHLAKKRWGQNCAGAPRCGQSSLRGPMISSAYRCTDRIHIIILSTLLYILYIYYQLVLIIVLLYYCYIPIPSNTLIYPHSIPSMSPLYPPIYYIKSPLLSIYHLSNSLK